MKIVLLLISFISVNVLKAEELLDFNCGKKSGSLANYNVLLNKVQERYNQTKEFKSNFRQVSYLASMEIEELSLGKLLYKRPSKMLWKYDSPDVQDFLIKDNTYWYYQADLNQLSIADFKDVAISDLPIAFLFGVGNLKQDFALVNACNLNEDLVFILKAKNEEEIQAIRLLVTSKTYFPKAITVEHFGGNRTRIYIEEPIFDEQIQDTVFELKLPKDIDIIDSRKKDETSQS